MPASYDIDTSARLVVFSLSDTVTEDHVLAAGLKLTKDPEYQPSFDSIWDFTSVTRMDVTLGGLKRIKEFEQTHSDRIGTGRRAMIAHSGSVTAVFNAYLWLCSPARITKVFRDMDSAREWLGLAG